MEVELRIDPEPGAPGVFRVQLFTPSIPGASARLFVTETTDGGAWLHALVVYPRLYRRGYARRVMLAARERWPAAKWSAHPDAAEFHAALVAEKIAERESGDVFRFAGKTG